MIKLVVKLKENQKVNEIYSVLGVNQYVIDKDKLIVWVRSIDPRPHTEYKMLLLVIDDIEYNLTYSKSEGVWLYGYFSESPLPEYNIYLPKLMQDQII